MSAFFASHGYVTRCNEVLEGRSGGRHEIDVLAEKTDPLTTLRVAIECKAWQHPIEKDVVSKLHYVLGDLALNKGIIVSLAGSRSGAERTANDLGIELWGPDELRTHLGDAVVGQLGVPPSTTSSTQVWGLSFVTNADMAERAIRSAGKGIMKIRTVESLLFFSAVWLPVYSVRLTIAQPEIRRRKQQLRSVTVDNLYDALGGQYLGNVRSPLEQIQVESRSALPPTLRDTKIHATLRKAQQAYERVTTDAAIARHTDNLIALGLLAPCSSLNVDRSELAYLPYYFGVLEAHGRQRVVAASGRTGTISDQVSTLLTAHLPQLRAHFTNRPSSI